MPSGPDIQPIRILHLSDFHFSGGKAWDADPVMGQLAGHIGQEVAGGMVPDLVAITGDLAFSGKAVEYERARRWLENKLWPQLGGLTKDRLLLVPGNHDVDRPAIKHSAKAVHSAFLDAQDQQPIAEVLQDPEERAPLLRRHTEYLAFHNAWYGADLELPWWQRSLVIRGRRLHLIGLDSAWLSAGDQDYGRLLLSRCQLHQLLFPEGENQSPALRIALLHHPWSYLAEFDGSEAEALIHLKCDLVLRGHLHRPGSERILPPDPNRACLELAAGCVYEDSQYPNAYHWIEVWPGDKTRVHFRTWLHQQWMPDRNVPGAQDGWADFRLGPAPPEQPEPAPAEPPSLAPPRPDATAGDAAQPFHVFLSHNSRDKPQVRELARQALVQQAALEEIGVADIFTRAPQGQPHGAVFGVPGCGKTTVLLKLLHLCLHQDPKELGLVEETLPLFLPLAQLDRQAMLQDQPLGPILGRGLELLAGPGLPKGLGERLWKRGRLLLLLDGLDEVADEGERSRVAAYLVKALTAAGGRGIRALVSCRIDSYGGEVRLPGFLALDVRPLDDPRIERFVGAWLGEAHRARSADPKLARLDAERQTGQLVSARIGCSSPGGCRTAAPLCWNGCTKRPAW